MNKVLISVIGPTAIGKTKLAIALANHYKTEIISADSRQFFKEMHIGTAVPSKEELGLAPHHFIQHKSIHEPYTVGDFEKEALQKISQLFKTTNVVIMVGGSGLYVDAVTNGLNVFPKIDPSIRSILNNQLKTDGITPLQEKLKEIDPSYFNKVDIHNPQRIIRALEITIGSGAPYSSFLNKPKAKRNFKVITVGLKAEREIIYNRINKRVDIMLQKGLLKEAEALLQYKELNALKTVGYRELFNYFDGVWEYDFAISEIKKNTRRFAKRQLTWFLKKEGALWFDHNENASNIILSISKKIESIKNQVSPILFVMGVSGSGKSTIAKLLANELLVPFFDGDDYHPQANIKKMSDGKPLNDEDRKGWLERLNELAKENTNKGAVIVCSALKSKYREALSQNLETYEFVYLKGSYELINQRLANRANHFMPSSLLKSQFEALEEPKKAITVSINQTTEKIVAEITKKLSN